MNRSLGFWKRFASCFTKVTQKTKRPTFHINPNFGYALLCVVESCFEVKAALSKSFSDSSAIEQSFQFKNVESKSIVQESEIKSKQNQLSERELSAAEKVSEFGFWKVIQVQLKQNSVQSKSSRCEIKCQWIRFLKCHWSPAKTRIRFDQSQVEWKIVHQNKSQQLQKFSAEFKFSKFKVQSTEFRIHRIKVRWTEFKFSKFKVQSTEFRFLGIKVCWTEFNFSNEKSAAAMNFSPPLERSRGEKTHCFNLKFRTIQRTKNSKVELIEKINSTIS